MGLKNVVELKLAVPLYTDMVSVTQNALCSLSVSRRKRAAICPLTYSIS